jgi:hypothetical protein
LPRCRWLCSGGLNWIGGEFSVEFAVRAATFRVMHRLSFWLSLMLLWAVTLSAEAATSRIVKVLPQYLDLKGRHSLSPSLYDRDAYQAHLRQHPAERSGIRFAVLWKAPARGQTIKMRVELRGIVEGNRPRQTVLEQDVTATSFSNWTYLRLAGDDYKKFGDVTAWRATLWSGDQLLGEQKSFLW